MNFTETNAFLGWVSQHDPRISNAAAAVEIWQASLNAATPAEAKQAILDHYRTNEAVVATPGGIRKRASTLRITADSQARALEAAPAPAKALSSWRSRNAGEWDRLVKQGRDKSREEIRRRAEANR